MRLAAVVFTPALVLLSVMTLFVTPAASQANDAFNTGCGKLPFQDIALEHKGVDDVCGIAGVTSANDTGNQQQNKLKNNFCIKNDPVVLRTTDLLTLQKKVDAFEDFKYGSARSVPEDRTPLKDIVSVNRTKIGEGTLVTIVGYMIDPHYSDVRKGEGVNCKKSGNERNDIHFSLSRVWREIDYSDKKAAQAQLCQLVSGEISPHYRPESWEVEHLSKIMKIPVRITGQLFFDASHVPCRGTKLVNPARASVWEVHPVYAIDVCRTKSRCRVNVAADWMSLDEWATKQHELEESEKDQ